MAPVLTAYAKQVRRDLPEGRRHTQLWLDAGFNRFLMTAACELSEGAVVEALGKSYVVTWGVVLAHRVAA